MLTRFLLDPFGGPGVPSWQEVGENGYGEEGRDSSTQPREGAAGSVRLRRRQAQQRHYGGSVSRSLPAVGPEGIREVAGVLPKEGFLSLGLSQRSCTGAADQP